MWLLLVQSCGIMYKIFQLFNNTSLKLDPCSILKLLENVLNWELQYLNEFSSSCKIPWISFHSISSIREVFSGSYINLQNEMWESMTHFLYSPFFLLLCPQSKNIDTLLSYITHLISFKRIFFVLIKLLNLTCTFKIIISYKILLVTIRNLGQAEPKQTDEIIMNIDKDSPRQPQPYHLYREVAIKYSGQCWTKGYYTFHMVGFWLFCSICLTYQVYEINSLE